MSCTYVFKKGKNAGNACGHLHCSKHNKDIKPMEKRKYKLGVKAVRGGSDVWLCEYCDFYVPSGNRGNLRTHKCYYQKITPLKERFYQRLIEQEISGGPASCRCGRADVLSDSVIVEIGRWSNWMMKIGQVSAYSVYYPGRQKRIHLFGEQPSDSVIDMISEVCDSLGIVLSYFPRCEMSDPSQA
jgi:hypothetical protein